MVKKVFLIILFAVFLLPINPVNAQNSNAGFIESNIWYSKDPFQEGDKIKIYTLVFNPEARELSGTVSFFDKNVLLGKKDFKVAPNGVRDVSIDWTVTAGSHIILAKIENAKYLNSSGTLENAYLDNTESDESRRTIPKKPAPDSSATSPTPVPQTDKKIQNLVVDNTPVFISKPIISTVEKMEKFRNDMSKTDSKVHVLFKYGFVFYGILLLVVFFMARFVWRKFF